MTDVRKCDGPECNIEALLDDEFFFAYTDIREEDFIEMTGRQGKKKHFHNDECMVRYARTLGKVDNGTT